MSTTPSIYDFIILPLRLKDQQEGKLFLERFLAGPQEIWEATRARIQDIKKLWSVSDCPDEQLQFLKNIVGWTQALNAITKNLDYATLRKLISLSVAMWKDRSSETAIYNALNLLVPGRARIWNWFDLRWILDETVLGEEHQGRDSYLVSMPDDAYWSNVRIVDNPVGEIDRTLVKELLNLMRPSGERYAIVYLKFLDLFESDEDVSQWDQGSAIALLVEDGMMKLRGPGIEITWANVEGADIWANYVASARVRAPSSGTLGTFGISFYLDDAQNFYYITLDLGINELAFGKMASGVPTNIVQFDFSTVSYTILPDVWYLLRVQISPEGATNRIKVYMDSEKYIDTTDATFSDGAVGLVNVNGTMLDCDEIEVLGLPVDSETVEINY